MLRRVNGSLRALSACVLLAGSVGSAGAQVTCQYGFDMGCAAVANLDSGHQLGIECTGPTYVASVFFLVCEVFKPGVVDVVVYDGGVERSRTSVSVSAPGVHEAPVATCVTGIGCIWFETNGMKGSVAQDPETAGNVEASVIRNIERVPMPSGERRKRAACPADAFPSPLEHVVWTMADTTSVGRVTGVVEDATNGEGISGCSIKLIDEGSGAITDTTTTDDLGGYELFGCGISPHRLHVEHLGYFPDSLTSISVATSVELPVVELTTRTVVLVHGAFSSGATWTNAGVNYPQALTAEGYSVLAVSLVQGGLPAWTSGSAGSIARQTDRLTANVESAILASGVRSFNIVAHSMGGLVSRQYDQLYPGRVRALIMLATPNHGTELATFSASAIRWTIDLLCQVDPGSCEDLMDFELPPVTTELDPHSRALSILNYGSPGAGLDNAGCRTHPGETTLVPTTSYVTYRGTAYDASVSRSDFCGTWYEYVLGGMVASASDCPTNDVVVPASSVPLATGGAANVVNVSDTNEGCLSTHRGTPCPAMLQDPCVTGFVIGALADPESFAVPDRVLEPSVSRGTSMPAAILDDGALGGPFQSHEFAAGVGSADSVYFAAEILTGLASFTIEDPDGHVIDPDSAAVDPNITYEEDGDHRIYTIRSPVAGDWTARVAVLGFNPTMIFVSGFEYSDTRLSLSKDASEVAPGTDVALFAALTDTGQPVTGATVTATIQSPDDSTAGIALEDDGTSPDAVADDGIYSGSATPNFLLGQYDVVVKAQGGSAGGTINRSVPTVYHVAERPDIAVAAKDIDLYVVAGDSLYGIDATLRNVGDAPAETLLVELIDDLSGLSFAESLVAGLSPGDSVTVSGTWPRPEGLFEVTLGARGVVLGEPGEANVSNNLAFQSLTVVAVPPGDDDGGPPGSVMPIRRPIAVPNPFRTGTTIRFPDASREVARVDVFDVTGRRVTSLATRVGESGWLEAYWDGRVLVGGSAPSGIFFYRAEGGPRRLAGRIVRVE